IRSVPGIQQSIEDFKTIKGTVPRLINPPSGCRFHPRCDYSENICSEQKPNLVTTENGHRVACHKWEDIHGDGS
ncbi:MAG: oligopeptide/dipeptide ABC transporter ATP-binding protein, partial [Candidatus Bipolaricaulota bacterium]